MLKARTAHGRQAAMRNLLRSFNISSIKDKLDLDSRCRKKDRADKFYFFAEVSMGGKFSTISVELPSCTELMVIFSMVHINNLLLYRASLEKKFEGWKIWIDFFFGSDRSFTGYSTVVHFLYSQVIDLISLVRPFSEISFTHLWIPWH